MINNLDSIKQPNDFLRKITQPYQTKTAPSVDRRLRLLVAFCLMNIALLSISLPFIIDAWLVIAAIWTIIFHTLIFALLRTRHYQIGIRIFVVYNIGFLFLGSFLVGLIAQAFALLSLWLVSFFLSRKHFSIIWGFLLLQYLALFAIDAWNPLLSVITQHSITIFVVYGLYTLLLTTWVHHQDYQQLQVETEALRSAQSRQNALLKSIPGFIATYNMHMRLEFFQNNSGIEIDDSLVLGQHLRNLLDGTTWETVKKQINRVIEEQEKIQFRTHLKLNNRTIWFDNWAVPIITNDKTDGFTIISFDVSQQHRTQQQLEERENWYRTLFEQSSDAIFITEMNGHIIEANQQANNLLGYTGDEFQTLVLSDLLVFNPDEERSTKPIEAEMTVHQRYMRSKQGELLAVVMGATSIRDQQGTPFTSILVRNITPLVKAQRALRESEARLRLVAEKLADIIFMYDLSDKMVSFVNPALETITGYTIAEITSANVHTLVHTDDHDLAHNIWQDAQQGKSGDANFRIHTKTGQLKWLNASWKPIADSQGEQRGIVGRLTDITETMMMRQTLKENEAFLRHTLDNVPVGIFIQQSGCLVYYNPSVPVITGYAPEQLEACNFASILNEHFRRTVQAWLDNPAASPQSLEVSLPTPQGYEAWINLTITQIPYQGRPAVMGTFTDITDTVNAQNELQHRERRYRWLVDNSYDLTILVDEQNEIEEITPAITRTLGYPTTHFIEKNFLVALQDLIHPDDLTTVLDIYGRSYISEQHAPTVFRSRVIHRNGDTLWIEGVLNTIHNPEFTRSGMHTQTGKSEDEFAERATIINARDITDLMSAYENERSQRALAEAIRDITVKINQSLNLDEVLATILDNLNTVIPHDAATIILKNEDEELKIAGQKGYDGMAWSNALRQFPYDELPIFQDMLSRQAPILLPDVSQNDDWVKIIEDDPPITRAYLGAPIMYQDEVIGFLNLDAYTPITFHEDHKSRLEAFAAQAGLAIHNASIYQQAREIAAAEERQRLARDLHDAVSQTLFSASMVAEALSLIIESHPQEARDGLAELQKLTRGSLAEMRTLLVELRPQALINTEFSALIRHLVVGLQTRTEAEVELDLNPCEYVPPSDVRINLYRIVQEAMNNVIKHAYASAVLISFDCDEGWVHVSVHDNGVGFDPTNTSTQNIGLRSMRERALAHKIDLDIHSIPGEGTVITAGWAES